LEKGLVHAYTWLPSLSGVRVEFPLKSSENNYGNKVTSHSAELGNFRDLEGTIGMM
jgi:hypothetical protein